MRTLSDKERAAFRQRVLSLGGATGAVLAVRSNGAAISEERRDEMLVSLREGYHVEVELEVRAFEQKTDAPNRNFMSFRPAAIGQLARSAAGMPFLRDHDQGNALARAGTITSARHEKVGEGHYVIHETVTLSAPWAVDLALRGLISSVSIGWHPESIVCSVCDSPVLEECYHLPGDRLESFTEGGKKHWRRSSSGTTTVEWVTTGGVLTETSIVNVPAVPTARIDEIRASLSAALETEESAVLARKDFIMLERISRVLGASAATEDEVLRRAEALTSELAIANRDRDEAQRRLATASAELEVLRAESRRAEREEFLRSGVAEGRLTPGDREVWATLYDANPTRARELMATRAPQSATPVGGALQSAAAAAPSASPGANGALDEHVEEAGATREGVLSVMRSLGLSEADARRMFEKQGPNVFGLVQEGA